MLLCLMGRWTGMFYPWVLQVALITKMQVMVKPLLWTIPLAVMILGTTSLQIKLPLLRISLKTRRPTWCWRPTVAQRFTTAWRNRWRAWPVPSVWWVMTRCPTLAWQRRPRARTQAPTPTPCLIAQQLKTTMRTWQRQMVNWTSARTR